ncbi:hypothetical protein PGIN_YH522_01087 [Porphyromonas gingivalis]|nr:hypothetical protein PGIN_YH522_01087 [Porphyromonas gingivalis]
MIHEHKRGCAGREAVRKQKTQYLGIAFIIRNRIFGKQKVSPKDSHGKIQERKLFFLLIYSYLYGKLLKLHKALSLTV